MKRLFLFILCIFSLIGCEKRIGDTDASKECVRHIYLNEKIEGDEGDSLIIYDAKTSDDYLYLRGDFVIESQIITNFISLETNNHKYKRIDIEKTNEINNTGFTMIDEVQKYKGELTLAYDIKNINLEEYKNLIFSTSFNVSITIEDKKYGEIKKGCSIYLIIPIEDIVRE